MKAIQRIRGSQYLQIRPDTAEKDNGQPAKATGKIENIVLFPLARSLYE